MIKDVLIGKYNGIIKNRKVEVIDVSSPMDSSFDDIKIYFNDEENNFKFMNKDNLTDAIKWLVVSDTEVNIIYTRVSEDRITILMEAKKVNEDRYRTVLKINKHTSEMFLEGTIKIKPNKFRSFAEIIDDSRESKSFIGKIMEEWCKEDEPRVTMDNETKHHDINVEDYMSKVSEEKLTEIIDTDEDYDGDCDGDCSKCDIGKICNEYGEDDGFSHCDINCDGDCGECDDNIDY